MTAVKVSDVPIASGQKFAYLALFQQFEFLQLLGSKFVDAT